MATKTWSLPSAVRASAMPMWSGVDLARGTRPPPVQGPGPRADGVALELLLRGQIAVHLGKVADAMPLQAAMQARPCEVRDRRLQRKEAIIERQERMAAKGHRHRLFVGRQNGRLRLPRTGRDIGNRGPVPPRRDRLPVHPIALRQRPQVLLTMLYRSTDCPCRGGAPVQNLSHSASLHAGENAAPSHAGIKQLEAVFLGL